MAKKFICSSTEPIIQTPCGKIRGFYLDGTYTFHGIKYADAERFKMPTPVQPWDGVKDALYYGSIAPLLEPLAAAGDLLTPHRFWAESEDCLYLNVWTRSLNDNAKKPVMVWLHGGGFAAGSSIEMIAYDGDNMSRYGDVVVVTLNHRLNILGYLDLSAFGEQYANTGNAGMADIVEALKWIQQNISYFGGDPDNVTIFGQSGGGAKVTALGQIPAAAGLFHRAIVMSGSMDFSIFGRTRNDKAIVDLILEDFNLTAKDIAQLETIPYYLLAKAFQKASKTLRKHNISGADGPIANDWYLGDPYQVGFSENAKKIPTMVGTVIAEFAFGPDIQKKHEYSTPERRDMIINKFGDAADELIRLYKLAYPGKNELDLFAIDAVTRPVALKYVEMKAAAEQAPIYSYMFSLEFDYDDGKLAWHCADIPFAFHNTDKVAICNIDGVTEKLEQEVFGAFVNFARTGNPNHAALPYWPAFTLENKATMVFDAKSEVRVDYDRELLDLMAKSGASFFPDFTI